MNTNRKWLKAFLVPKVKKVGLAFLILNLVEFSIFDSFLNLANFSLFDFWDLSNF